MNLNDVPLQYRPIAPYVKISNDFKDHDKVLYYWLLNYAVEKALAIGSPSVDASKAYLMSLLDVLEKIKEEHKGDESYMVGPVAQCHVEAKALRLFTNADEQDRQGIFDKNVVKSFYTSGLLFDILSLFTKEELEEKLQEAKKYAKWKATYIHNCLKNGQIPQSGPPTKSDEDDELTRGLLNLDVTKPQPTPRSTSNVPIPGPFNQPNIPTQQFGQEYGHQGQGYVQPSQQYGGFAPAQYHHNPNPNPQPGQSEISLDDFIEARKLTKMATSALDYEDAKTAIDFLRKALNILEK